MHSEDASIDAARRHPKGCKWCQAQVSGKGIFVQALGEKLGPLERLLSLERRLRTMGSQALVRREQGVPSSSAPGPRETGFARLTHLSPVPAYLDGSLVFTSPVTRIAALFC